jgi:hypothetical protein
MWRDIGKATLTGGKRTARDTAMVQLFGDERRTAAILEFLATMEVGLSGRKARQMAVEEDPRGGLQSEVGKG